MIIEASVERSRENCQMSHEGGPKFWEWVQRVGAVCSILSVSVGGLLRWGLKQLPTVGSVLFIAGLLLGCCLFMKTVGLWQSIKRILFDKWRRDSANRNMRKALANVDIGKAEALVRFVGIWGPDPNITQEDIDRLVNSGQATSESDALPDEIKKCLLKYFLVTNMDRASKDVAIDQITAARIFQKGHYALGHNYCCGLVLRIKDFLHRKWSSAKVLSDAILSDISRKCSSAEVSHLLYLAREPDDRRIPEFLVEVAARINRKCRPVAVLERDLYGLPTSLEDCGGKNVILLEPFSIADGFLERAVIYTVKRLLCRLRVVILFAAVGVDVDFEPIAGQIGQCPGSEVIVQLALDAKRITDCAPDGGHPYTLPIKPPTI